MVPYPTQILRKNDALELRWSDGLENQLAANLLRRQCPCASCRESRGDGSHSAPLGGAENKAAPKPSILKVLDHSAVEQLRIEEVRSVGNYAISICWGDKHNTGIYTFEQLRTLSEAVA